MRRTLYTTEGIKRVPCSRCGAKPSHASWQVCADNRAVRALCMKCDIALNRMVLRWARDPDADRKLRAYRERVAQ